MMKSRVLTLALLFALQGGCVEKIPGDPAKVTRQYVEAVMKGDHETLLRLNHISARRLKYFDMSEVPQDKEIEREYREEQRKEYEATPPDFTPGVRWAERHFFPPGCAITIGAPRRPEGANDDPVNADYEAGGKVIVPVTVTYPDKAAAPRFQGKPLAEAVYDCFLSKIREGKNVRIYSHDERWYVNGFILNIGSVRFAE